VPEVVYPTRAVRDERPGPARVMKRQQPLRPWQRVRNARAWPYGMCRGLQQPGAAAMWHDRDG
jgi:hypothetical protein